MVTRTIKIESAGEPFTPEEEAELREAGEIIKRGGLVAFPTETVYGLGGDAFNRESSRRIYAAKGRPSDNPLIVHICRLEDIPALVSEWPEAARRIAEAFWPGPLTMILPKSDRVPPETTGGLDTVAIRMPSHPVARRLIACGGGYIAAPSANTSGRPSPTLAKYVAEDMQGRIEMIIDGGEVGIGLESTILDLTVSPPQILRPGYVTRGMLAEVLGQVDVDAAIARADIEQVCNAQMCNAQMCIAPRAPGMKYRHYAPIGDMTIVQGPRAKVTAYINTQAARARASGKRVGVIGTQENLEEYRADAVKSVGRRGDEESIARRLYAILREFDDEKTDVIYSESFDGTDFGQAIMNRLLKAAGYQVIRLEE